MADFIGATKGSEVAGSHRRIGEPGIGFRFLFRLGILVTGVGVVFDLAVHATGWYRHLAGPLRSPAHLGHLVVFAGMVLTLAGLSLPVLMEKVRQRQGRVSPVRSGPLPSEAALEQTTSSNHEKEVTNNANR